MLSVDECWCIMGVEHWDGGRVYWFLSCRSQEGREGKKGGGEGGRFVEADALGAGWMCWSEQAIGYD